MAGSFDPSVGFQRTQEDDEADAKARHMQLHNTIVRALLVDEVYYEPAKLLKKSRRVVLLITGADLVLVKMTKATTTAAHPSTTGPCTSAAREGSGDGGSAGTVEDALATVLAQHELNKMVKCQVIGNRLELEFIVTGSARFKASAAALGFSGSEPLGPAAPGPAVSRESSSHSQHMHKLYCQESVAVGLGQAGASSGISSASAAHDHYQQQHCVSTTVQPSVTGPGAGWPGAGGPGNEDDGGCKASAAARFPADHPSVSSSHSDSAAGRPSPASFAAEDLQHDSLHRHRSLTWQASSPRTSSRFGPWRSSQRRGSQTSQNSSGVMGTADVGSSSSRLRAALSAGITWEDASRTVSSTVSGSRAVKTDDGEYWVAVEAFALQFRDATLCELAASLLRSSRATMRVALDWLKQGLPFSPEFAVTHLTELSSSRTGPEVLVAGPIPWGTDLQLPDSWVRTITTATVPQDQPLHTPLEVADGPAAFKVHLATPAGGTPSSFLAPVASFQLTGNTDNDGHFHDPLNAVTWSHDQLALLACDSMSRASSISSADSEACSDVQPVEAADLASFTEAEPATHQGRQLSIAQGPGAGQQCTLCHDLAAITDDETELLTCTPNGSLTEFDLQGHSCAHLARPAAVGAADSSRTAYSSSNSGRLSGGAAISDSKPLPSNQGTYHVGLPVPAAGLTGGSVSSTSGSPFASTPVAVPTINGKATAAGMHDPGSRAGLRQLPLRHRRSKSSGNLAAGDLDPQTSSWRALLSYSTTKRHLKQAVHRYRHFGTSNTQQSRQNSGSSTNSRQHGGSRMQSFELQSPAAPCPCTAADSFASTEGSVSAASSAAGVHKTHARTVRRESSVPNMRNVASSDDSSHHSAAAFPKALAANSSGGEAVGHEGDGQLQMFHLEDLQGPDAGEAPAAANSRSQLLAGADGDADDGTCDAVRKGSTLFSPSSTMLLLLAAAVNILCMWTATDPVLARYLCRQSVKAVVAVASWLKPFLKRPRPSGMNVASHSAATTSTGSAAAQLAGPAAAGEVAAASGSAAASATAASAAQDLIASGGIRVRLLGASFVKEALGLLEEQVNAFKHLQMQAALAAALAASQGQSDWRHRIVVARPTLEERQKLAGAVHAWRLQYNADNMLQQPYPHFKWFKQHLDLKLLTTTLQGHVVVLIKMNSLVNMSRLLASAGLSPSDLTAYCGFIWGFMFEVLMPLDHPGGRFVLVADMSNIKLGQAMGEGQVGGRALGDVCNAYPERLVRCLILGTPSWFNMLYRLIRPHLGPSTRAKVQVCDGRCEAATELAACIGADLVPHEYGGPCTLDYDQYPAQQQLLQFVQELSSAA
eukprot:gene5378-5613_t